MMSAVAHVAVGEQMAAARAHRPPANFKLGDLRNHRQNRTSEGGRFEIRCRRQTKLKPETSLIPQFLISNPNMTQAQSCMIFSINLEPDRAHGDGKRKNFKKKNHEKILLISPSITKRSSMGTLPRNSIFGTAEEPN